MARNDDQNDEKQESPRDSGKTKTILLSAVVVTSVIALSVGITLIVTSGRHDAAAAATDKKAEHAEKKTPPLIYSLEPFIVNIRDGEELRYMKVKVELETGGGAESKGEIDPFLAPLRDSILAILSNKNFLEISDIQGKNRLRDEILASCGTILKPGKIKKVYFTDFVVQ